MTIVVYLYSAVGYYGYIKYGDAAEVSITLNLPSHLFLAELVRLLMMVAVFASYALQFYVRGSILWVRQYIDTSPSVFPLLEIVPNWPSRQYETWNWILWKDLLMMAFRILDWNQYECS